MEAAENQLPINGPVEGAVRALDDRLVIAELTIADHEAARVVRERAEGGEEPAQTVRRMLEIGARVLDREVTAAEVDYVRAEFEKQAAAIRERLGRALEEGDRQLAERIAASFDGSRDDSVQRQILELLNRALTEQRSDLAKQFSAEDGANPLADFKGAMIRALKQSDERHQAESQQGRQRIEELSRELVKLRERSNADERVAEAEEAGTRKGLSFEERVHTAIERIAGLRSDSATHTGGEQAEGGGRKGDTLVELGAAEGASQGRLLFEAKDKKLTKNQAWAELNEGMTARAAAFAVLVVAGEERVPAGRETLTEYEGNKLIVAVDRDDPDGLPLELAYRLAAARLAMARDRELRVDAAAVLDLAEEAVSGLKHAQAIRSTLTGIKTSSDKARTNLDAMVEAVRAKLERIESLVSDAE